MEAGKRRDAADRIGCLQQMNKQNYKYEHTDNKR